MVVGALELRSNSAHDRDVAVLADVGVSTWPGGYSHAARRQNERRNLHYYPRSLDNVGESGAHAMGTNLLPPSSRRTLRRMPNIIDLAPLINWHHLLPVLRRAMLPQRCVPKHVARAFPRHEFQRPTYHVSEPWLKLHAASCELRAACSGLHAASSSGAGGGCADPAVLVGELARGRSPTASQALWSNHRSRGGSVACPLASAALLDRPTPQPAHDAPLNQDAHATRSCVMKQLQVRTNMLF